MEQLFKDQINYLLGVVLLDNQEQFDSVEHPFKDQISYLLNLCNRREISKAELDQMRPKNAKPARIHGSQRYIKYLPTSQNLDLS